MQQNGSSENQARFWAKSRKTAEESSYAIRTKRQPNLAAVAERMQLRTETLVSGHWVLRQWRVWRKISL